MHGLGVEIHRPEICSRILKPKDSEQPGPPLKCEIWYNAAQYLQQEALCISSTI